MTYNEALEYIHSVCWKGSRPGLERIRTLMGLLGDPQNRLKFIHIAGTNGKGSTAAMLSSILARAGYRTGLFTSPYILCFRERMQLQNEMIPEAELAEITAYVKPFAQRMTDRPTEFELITAIALVWFAKKRCDIVVLEAGMGGALDSTNVIPSPEVAVFTNIGLDHTEYLGDSVEKIAATKAGILKPGCHCVLYPNTAAVEQVIEAACAEKGIPLRKAAFDAIVSKDYGLEGQRFDMGNERNLFLPLLGDHQLKNASVALQTVALLRSRGWSISSEAVRAGLAAVQWPGRFEVLCSRPLFLLDGGHNPQCMEALAQTAEKYLQARPLTVLTGVLADKDYNAMYACTAKMASGFITVTPPNPRALPAHKLADYLGRYGKPVTACNTLEEGVLTALQTAGTDGAVLAYGSLYMAGRIREEVKRLTGK